MEMMRYLTRLADELSEDIQSIGDGNVFKLVSKKGRRSLPIVVWKLHSDRSYNGKCYWRVLKAEKYADCYNKEFSVAAKLKSFGWMVPAYTIHAGAVDTNLMRVVVRSDLTLDRKKAFMSDLTRVSESAKTFDVVDAHNAR